MTDPILKIIGEDFELTAQDRNSATWRRLEEHLTARLAQLRAKNDRPLSEQETATLRGQIACLKEIIALGKDPAPLDANTSRPTRDAPAGWEH
jgi:hypothetical protein